MILDFEGFAVNKMETWSFIEKEHEFNSLSNTELVVNFYHGNETDAALDNTYFYLDDITIEEKLSTSNFNSYFNFSYSPNPAKNQFSVEARKVISKIELFNTTGQNVLSKNMNALKSNIDVSSLQKGIYLMRASIENKTATYKIIKE